MKTILTVSAIRALPFAQQGKALRDAQVARHEAIDEIVGRGVEEGRSALASEAREVGKHQNELRDLSAFEAELQQMADSVIDTSRGYDGSGTQYRSGDPLTRTQTFEGFVRSRGLLSEVEKDEELSLRKVLRGVVLGDWNGADAEQRAMSGLTAAAGGVVLPTLLSAQIIDLARAKTRVLEAGATIVPMDSRNVDVPKWTADPTPGWRAEKAAIVESDGLMDKVTLTAKSLAVLTRATREWLEDVDGGDQALKHAFAASFALKLDAAALYGAGGAVEPQGVKTAPGVTVAAIATNGGTPTWDTLAQAAGRLRDRNEEPNAQIMADRTKRGLELQREGGTTGPYLAPPVYLDSVSRLSTAQVPTNLTQGTASGTASDLFTGDWSQLFVGVRTALQIQVLNERYADTGEIGFLGWHRGDIAVARASAFDVVTGLTS
jgi:HK97 family phage major capsid protein